MRHAVIKDGSLFVKDVGDGGEGSLAKVLEFAAGCGRSCLPICLFERNGVEECS
jgi:hypothetical protein